MVETNAIFLALMKSDYCIDGSPLKDGHLTQYGFGIDTVKFWIPQEIPTNSLPDDYTRHIKAQGHESVSFSLGNLRIRSGAGRTSVVGSLSADYPVYNILVLNLFYVLTNTAFITCKREGINPFVKTNYST